VINALGFVVNPLVAMTTPALKTGRKNIILADEAGRTSLDRVYAGGDAITGGATVISALGHGKRAAQSIHSMIFGAPDTESSVAAGVTAH
jgi:glutamate synthase (NADPH/NADH) small chain